MKLILTIGGSDCSGGSGIQSDIKTILVNGCYSTTVITALAAHGKEGTKKFSDLPADRVREQIDVCVRDAMPDAVKIGMIPNAETAKVVAEKINEYGFKNVVVNPLLLAHSGDKLVPRDAYDIIVSEILPLADFITPDLNELEFISGMKIEQKSQIIDASKIAGDKFGCVVATKGGKIAGDAADLFYRDGYYKWFPGMIIPQANLHDAGNAMAAAVAANLAKGYEPDKAYKCAKDCITEMLLNMVTFGNGVPTINQAATVTGAFMGVLSDEELSRM